MCDWDGGDCCPDTCEDGVVNSCSENNEHFDCNDPDSNNYTTVNCTVRFEEFLGDGFCDRGGYNVDACGWDAGDCCFLTCTEPRIEKKQIWTCGDGGYECKDNTTCMVEHASWLADGYCDDESGFNTAVCQWDGGDCCTETCVTDSFNCGDTDDTTCYDPEYCTAANDAERDLICDDADFCIDADGDSVCEPADTCPADAENDADNDATCGDVDSCPYDALDDVDSDGICDSVDSCKVDAENDADGDDLCGNKDDCPYDAENDADSDALCGELDSCPYDSLGDRDGDGACEAADSCPIDALDDVDSDGVCDSVDSCKVDAENDADGDDLCGNTDDCPYNAENDADSDALCGELDSCPYDAADDYDEDGKCAHVDPCPLDPNNDLDSDNICSNTTAPTPTTATLATSAATTLATATTPTTATSSAAAPTTTSNSVTTAPAVRSLVTVALPADNETADASIVLATSMVAGAVVLAAVVVGATVFCIRRNKRARKHLVHAVPHVTAESSSVAMVKAVHIAVDAADDANNADVSGLYAGRAAALVAQMQERLQSNPPSWVSSKTLARLVCELDSLEERTLSEAEHGTRTEAVDALHTACGEYQLQMDAAVAAHDYRKVEFYGKRVKILAAALPFEDGRDSGDASVGGGSLRTRVRTASSQFECVVPDLLLKKDRFDGDSDAFLGRGASSAVSRGLLVEVVGQSFEKRTAVAVKEVQKMGAAKGGEQRAVNELVIVTQKLGPHPNVVQVLGVKATGSMFYVVMELCLFSLDKQPEAFAALLHTADAPAPGALVLNALVQDLVRGLAFLHSKHVFHCDLKPGNVLVALDRRGKKRTAFKPKYFKEAQLKLADFGVSRVVQPSAAGTGGGVGGGADATTMTATVSLAGLHAAQGIAGTEAYMCPELLQILRDLRANKLDAEPDIGADLLTRNDAFGCGCVAAYLCSRGKHPFQHSGLFHSSLPDNILGGRRTNLHKLGICDARHVDLVDKFTRVKGEGERWTAAQALRRSPIFSGEAAGGVTAADILLDTIELRQKPVGSCRDQLLAPRLVAACPLLPAMVEQMEPLVQDLHRGQRVSRSLDEDSLMALVAFTSDNGVDRDGNIYYGLNNALRSRAADPAPFKRWQGFLYFLMRALDQLPAFRGTVFRGGNEGLDQATVRREYTVGRPIQWAAFSSATTTMAAARDFVDKRVGVLFKLSVLSGRDIGAYSSFPKENEVLLSPNTRFVVTSELYQDAEGYACIDLAETAGHTLQS